MGFMQAIQVVETQLMDELRKGEFCVPEFVPYLRANCNPPDS